MTDPVTIVGGGIGGLSCAIALAQAKIPVRVIERADAFKAIGYGIQLGPNALHAFRALGIEATVLAKCSLPEEGLLKDAYTGDLLLRLPMGRQMVDRFGQPYAVIHRADLHQILIDACHARGVELITDCELMDFDDDGQAVTLETSTGRISAPALIAADGSASRIRTKLVTAPEPEKLGYVAFRAVHPIERMPRGTVVNNVTLWCGGGFHMIHYPLRGGTLFNIVAAFDYRLDGDDTDAPYADRIKKRFASACDEIRILLDYVDFSRHWEIMAIEPLAAWSKGRVALLGDAGHAMVQAMAQGACQAIEDGLELANCLKNDPHDAALALKHYESHRILRATRVQYMSRFMWELIHVRKGYAKLRRDLLGRIDDVGALEALSWLYSDNREVIRKESGQPRYEPECEIA